MGFFPKVCITIGTDWMAKENGLKRLARADSTNMKLKNNSILIQVMPTHLPMNKQRKLIDDPPDRNAFNIGKYYPRLLTFLIDLFHKGRPICCSFRYHVLNSPTNLILE